MAVLLTFAPAMPALAIGHWNVPGNVAQWWGYGWGAGHHACLALGPISHKGAFARHQVRLRHSPQPVYGCYDNCSYDYSFPQPSQHVTPAALPLPEAAPAPDEVLPAPVEP
jgi:hypothetical protein